MNLYVWNNPYRVNYGASILFVMAESIEEAKRKAIRAKWFKHGYEKKYRDELERKSYQDYAKAVISELGEPRIVGPITAEFHEWSE